MDGPGRILPSCERGRHTRIEIEVVRMVRLKEEMKNGEDHLRPARICRHIHERPLEGCLRQRREAVVKMDQGRHTGISTEALPAVGV